MIIKYTCMPFKKQGIDYKEPPLTSNDSTITFSGTFSDRSLASICANESLPSLPPLVSTYVISGLKSVGIKPLLMPITETSCGTFNFNSCIQ